jgi:hypothetical protein
MAEEFARRRAAARCKFSVIHVRPIDGICNCVPVMRRIVRRELRVSRIQETLRRVNARPGEGVGGEQRNEPLTIAH